DEEVTMHLHPIIGETIVRPLRSGAGILPIIRSHHEHWDGNGYPDRLVGSSIPELARIVAVCDAFDALVNDRPYRSRKTVNESLTILRAGAGRQWDPRVVDAFLACVPSLTASGAA
ncbi:MAG: HD domain-containing protein, partial [Chloroflexi bacterium]